MLDKAVYMQYVDTTTCVRVMGVKNIVVKHRYFAEEISNPLTYSLGAPWLGLSFTELLQYGLTEYTPGQKKKKKNTHRKALEAECWPIHQQVKVNSNLSILNIFLFSTVFPVECIVIYRYFVQYLQWQMANAKLCVYCACAP